MDRCNVELIGTLMQINQFRSEKNILDIILEIKSEVCHTKDEYTNEKFTVLLYKTLDFSNKNLIVGKKIKIKGRLIIVPTEIEILKGDDEECHGRANHHQ